MYAKTDKLVQRFAKAEDAGKSLSEDMTGVKAATAEVTRWGSVPWASLEWLQQR
ncbi:hypothetical protein X735_15325 [Mesorhizobium sp. L2C085B000]|uniref:DUF1515 family protein n=1 Tax=unclassified Mesorhizobium TaxID=325217 RepID=UPI0003CFF151|nr:DUF1515 family protein [Mesorhizobium sp. L2C085B000]ESZ14966.1 hypothetical protein X735_15325 [Mesorhizobium sp. L2C085B000]